MSTTIATTTTTTTTNKMHHEQAPLKQQRDKSASVSHSQTVKSKKESPQATPLPVISVNATANALSQQPPSQSQVKKLTRKSSKPIINWFQRKLAGTRARRASEGDALRAQRVAASRPPNVKEKRRSSVPVPPLPTVPVRQRSRQNGRSQQQRAASIVASTKHNTISLDSDYDLRSVSDGNTIDSDDQGRTSSLLESTWSPNSVYEADEDASVRPIPPSAPPSPSPSHSSSSYLSHPRTFASMAASTKPTTLLSVDLTGGMAHIAQAPPTPTIPGHRMSSHIRTHSTGLSSGGSITFSMLPPSSPSRPSSANHGHVSSVSSRGHTHSASLQAPQHTTHHPRNNPRPSSPPLDDASVLTLASSAFGLPGARSGGAFLGRSGRTSVADDSISHFSHPGLGDSTSQFLLGDGEGDDDRAEEERYRYGDVDASVRALRPRSSRRGSWESEASGWSAQLTGAQVSGIGTPNGPKERSLWTNGSHRTGARSLQTENDNEDGDAATEDNSKETYDEAPAPKEDDHSQEMPDPKEGKEFTSAVPEPVTLPLKQESLGLPLKMESTESVSHSSHQSQSRSVAADKASETPKGGPIPLEDAPTVPTV